MTRRRDRAEPRQETGGVSASGSGQAVGINNGVVLQQFFAGPFARLRDVTIDLSQLPYDVGLADPRDPADPVGLFTGREWLLRQIDDFTAECVRDRAGGYLFIEAEAGMGKSALAARLAFTRAWPTHATRLLDGQSPQRARANLAAQLIARWGLTDSAPGGVLPAGHDTTLWLYQQLRAAAQQRDRTEPGTPVVMLIDGLDEAPPAPAGQLPLGLPTQLPPGTAVIATTRPGIRLPPRIGRVRRIEVESELNHDDLIRYLRHVVERDPRLAAAIDRTGTAREVFSRRLRSRADGVWIYVTMVLDQIRGGRLASDVDRLPTGLAAYYAENLDRWHDDPDIRLTEVGLPLLAMLAAVREPQPAAVLAGWADLPAPQVRALVRGPLKPFLLRRPGGDPDRYAVRHHSLRQFCEGALPSGPDVRDGLRELVHDLSVATRRAHARIVDVLTPADSPAGRDWSRAGDYARSFLAEHAAVAGLLDDLVLDPGFLLLGAVSDLLRQRRHLTTGPGHAAVSALELASNSWHADRGDELIWLASSARRLRCHPLAEAAHRQLRPQWSARHAFWRGTSHRRLYGPIGRTTVLTAVTLADGRPVLAGAGADRTVWLWDPNTAVLLAELKDHTAAVNALAAVLLADGSWVLASAGDDHTVRLWDPDTASMRAELAGHTGKVTALVVLRLADGTPLLASVSDDRTVRLWNLQTAALHAELTDDINLSRRPLAVTALADGTNLLVAGGLAIDMLNVDLLRWHARTTGRTGGDGLAVVELADGSTVLAVGGRDGIVRLWDPDTATVRGELTGGGEWIRTLMAVGLAGGTTLLASTGGREPIRLWNPNDGSVYADLIGYQGSAAMAVVGLADGTTLLATASASESKEAGDDGPIRLWNLDTATLQADMTGHTKWISALEVIRLLDGTTLLASASADDTVRLWNLNTATLPTELTGHNGPVYGLAAVPDADGDIMLASAGRDHTVRLWELGSGTLRSELVGHTDKVSSLAAIPFADGHALLASASADVTVRVWDPGAACLRAELTGYTDYWDAQLAVVGLPDGGALLVVAGNDGSVRAWDPHTGDLHAELTDHTSRVTALAVVAMADGTTLVAASNATDSGGIPLWNPDTGHLRAVMHGYTSWTDALAVVAVAEGPVLLASAAYRTIRLWDPNTATVRADLTGHTSEVSGLATVDLAGGTTLLASGHRDGTLRLWDPNTATLHAELTGHAGVVHALAVIGLADGTTLLASAGGDETVRLWDPNTATLHAELIGHTGAVYALAVLSLADGTSLLASAGEDASVIVWTQCE